MSNSTQNALIVNNSHALITKNVGSAVVLNKIICDALSLAKVTKTSRWTPEEEQKLMPVVIELFDGAMGLGQVTFKKAVRYVREFIASGIDQETADSIPYEILQGAYIAATGRHKDKPVTPLMEMAKFASLEDVYKDGKT